MNVVPMVLRLWLYKVKPIWGARPALDARLKLLHSLTATRKLLMDVHAIFGGGPQSRWFFVRTGSARDDSLIHHRCSFCSHYLKFVKNLFYRYCERGCKHRRTSPPASSSYLRTANFRRVSAVDEQRRSWNGGKTHRPATIFNWTNYIRNFSVSER